MPTYVYRCPDCEIEVEERRKISQADDPLNCPLCGERLARAITTFIFNTGRGGSAPAPESQPVTKAHTTGCPCCWPMR